MWKIGGLATKNKCHKCKTMKRKIVSRTNNRLANGGVYNIARRKNSQENSSSIHYISKPNVVDVFVCSSLISAANVFDLNSLLGLKCVCSQYIPKKIPIEKFSTNYIIFELYLRHIYVEFEPTRYAVFHTNFWAWYKELNIEER